MAVEYASRTEVRGRRRDSIDVAAFLPRLDSRRLGAGAARGSLGPRRRRRSMAAAAFLRRLDWLLLGAVAALVAYGLWAIAGITHHDVSGNPDYYVVRQGVFVAGGFVVFLAALVVDPDWYRRHWRLIFGGTAC